MRALSRRHRATLLLHRKSPTQPLHWRKSGLGRLRKGYTSLAWDEEGRLAHAQRRGRTESATKEEDVMIVAVVAKDPFLNAKEIWEALQLYVSAKTIQRRLHKSPVRSCVAPQKPHLTYSQRLARLEFARAAQQL